ncbi:MAG: DUF1501 domain-containing protein [Candidatus Kapaibacterium sp.]|jgi:uncharacterized protein (DUF1501 family)
MKRRTFLQGIAATAAAAPIMLNGVPARAMTSLPLLAQMEADAGDKILIIIQLFGGNDGLNTVIPIGQDEYYKLRPVLGIAEKDADNVLGAGKVYLNRALSNGSRGGLTAMLGNGTAALIQGIGYDKPNLSHFRSTDIWLSGINNSDPNVRLDTGWVGRYLEKRYPTFPLSLPDDPLAIQLGGFSLALMSSKGRMGIEVGDPSKQKGVSSTLGTLDMDSVGTHYEMEYAFVADIAARSNKYAANVKAAYAAGSAKLQAQYASDVLSQQMASVAALIAGGLKTRVYVVSMGGFDTHVTQQTDALNGPHPTLLGRLADSTAQFMFDMVRLGYANNIIGMTVSEFGRRPAENGSFGTDHGASSVQFVFGTQVNSGVFGQTPDLTNLDENGDLPYQIDYRRVYTEILGDWFGLTLPEARVILQDDSLTPIDVIKPQAGVAAPAQPVRVELIQMVNYPNPFSASTTVQINLEARSTIRVDITNTAGQHIATLAEGMHEPGTYKFPFTQAEASGTYICSVEAGGKHYTRMMQCTK